MAEQLKLFEDILPLNGTPEKRKLTEQRMIEKKTKLKEKPYYVHNMKTNELEDVNNPNDSLYPRGPITKKFDNYKKEGQKQLEKLAVQSHPNANSEFQKMYAKQDPETQSILKKAIQSSSTKHPPIRKETESERVERYLWLYDEGEKPAHYDDPLIEKVDTFQGFAKAMPLKKENNIIKKKMPTPPRQFNSMDKSTYPSNPKVKANLSTWDLMIATAKTPKEKGEIRRVLRDEFVKNGVKNLSDSEQKMIGRGKYQSYPTITVPSVDMDMIPEPTPRVPDVPIEEIIRVRAQERLEREQNAFDRENGTGGIMKLMRPE